MTFRARPPAPSLTAWLALAFVSSGCLGWDTAQAEYCARPLDPRPEECGGKLLGLAPSSALFVGDTASASSLGGLASLADDLIVAVNGNAPGVAARSATVLRVNHGIPYPVWTGTYSTLGSSESVSLGGVAAGPSYAVVGGHYEGTVRAIGDVTLQNAAAGARPFVQAVAIGQNEGTPLALWTVAPEQTTDAQVRFVHAPQSEGDPVFLLAGTFAGTLSFSPSLPVNQSPTGQGVYFALGRKSADTFDFLWSWSMAPRSGATVSLIDAKVSPVGVACLLVRAQGGFSTAFDGDLEYPNPTLVMLCSAPSRTLQKTELPFDDARLGTNFGDEFVVAATNSAGLVQFTIKAAETGLSMTQEPVLLIPGAGIRPGAIDVDAMNRREVVVLASYEEPVALARGLRLPDTDGRDLVLVRAGADGLEAANTYHQAGSEEVPLAVTRLPGSRTGFVARVRSDALVDLAPLQSMGSVAPTPHLTAFVDG